MTKQNVDLDWVQVIVDGVMIVAGFYFSNMISGSTEPTLSDACARGGVELTETESSTMDFVFTL